MAKNRLAIVILNWNCAQDSIACAESLLSQTLVPDIVFVDNASSDNSVDLLRSFTQSHSGCVLIENSINTGYTGGNNSGFRYALEHGYTYVGTLNPDAIADRQWVRSLMSELEKFEDTGITTGLILSRDGATIDTSGEFYYTWGIPGPRGRGAARSTAPDLSAYVFGTTGGGFIVSADVVRRVGLFDETFFMYFEDIDFSFRVQLAGYRVRFTPKAVAYHATSTSTRKVPGLATKQTFKNLPLVFLKNIPFQLWPTILPRFILSYGLIFGNAIISGRGIPAISGWIQSITLIPHALYERRRIQSFRTASASYINSIIIHDIPPEQTGLRKFRKLFTGRS